jgi:hypothetical protein
MARYLRLSRAVRPLVLCGLAYIGNLGCRVLFMAATDLSKRGAANTVTSKLLIHACCKECVEFPTGLIILNRISIILICPESRYVNCMVIVMSLFIGSFYIFFIVTLPKSLVFSRFFTT